MILGVGLDVVDIAAFGEQLGLPGTMFGRVFTARERREAAARAGARGAVGGKRPQAHTGDAAGANPDGVRTPSGSCANAAEHLAARWAAKEAFIKAWSTALYGRPPILGEVAWHEIEVVSDRWHRPRLVLHGDVAEAFAESIGNAAIRFHLSLTHDGPVAQAIVIVEAAEAERMAATDAD